jgi:hypothetical protein
MENLRVLGSRRVYSRAGSCRRFAGANGRGRELTLATRCRMGACYRSVHKALIGVHGEFDYDAHRLPAGKTAAKEKERGRPAGQAAKLFEDRQLLLSKASAPFVETGEF